MSFAHFTPFYLTHLWRKVDVIGYLNPRITTLSSPSKMQLNTNNDANNLKQKVFKKKNKLTKLTRYINQVERDGKQLPDRRSDRRDATPSIPGKAPLELVLVVVLLGEPSRLRRRILPMTEIGSSSSSGLQERKRWQNVVWRRRASSTEIRVEDRTTSSLTASAQSPQSQCPLWRSLTRWM